MLVDSGVDGAVVAGVLVYDDALDDDRDIKSLLKVLLLLCVVVVVVKLNKSSASLLLVVEGTGERGRKRKG